MYSISCDTDMKPKIRIPEETKRAISDYHEALTTGKEVAGARVLKALHDSGLDISSPDILCGGSYGTLWSSVNSSK
jgi:hypothetical protein